MYHNFYITFAPGVVTVMEVEVWGTVNAPELGEVGVGVREAVVRK